MKCWLLLLVIPLMVSAATTPGNIEHAITEYDVKNFAKNTPPAQWNETIKNISFGKSEWLVLVPKLTPVISFEQGIQLSNALYYSIEPNTKDTLVVLNILDKQKIYQYQQGTGTSCVPPMSESGKYDEALYQKTRIALLNVGPQGADCLWVLEAAVEELKTTEAQKAQ